MKETTTIYAGARSDGSAVYEEVVVESMGNGQFRLMQSPGLVLGVASGDVIELDEGKRPRVVSRSGNLCIQVYTKGGGARLERALLERLLPLSARLDGKSLQQLVFTVPVSVGFAPIESALAAVVKEFPGIEWFYGNVYDPKDGVTPLNWWLKAPGKNQI